MEEITLATITDTINVVVLVLVVANNKLIYKLLLLQHITYLLLTVY